MMLSTWPCSNRTVSIKQGSNRDLSDENSVESRGFRGSMSKISEIQILYSVHSRDICNELPLLVSLCMRKRHVCKVQTVRMYLCSCRHRDDPITTMSVRFWVAINLAFPYRRYRCYCRRAASVPKIQHIVLML